MLAHERERGEPVELRERKIGEHQVEFALLCGHREIRARLGMPDPAIGPFLAQRRMDQFGIGRIVLEVEDAKRGGSGTHGVRGLAIFAVMASLVGAFYYLRVVKVMYFDSPITATTVSAPADVRAVLSVNGALVLVLGIVPGWLMALCTEALRKMLAS